MDTLQQSTAERDVWRSEGQLTSYMQNVGKHHNDTREEGLAATLLDALDLGEVLC